MKKKRILFFSLAVLFCFLLTGCSLMTNLTSDEEDQIALYTAKVISKYNTKQKQGVTYISDETRQKLAKQQDSSDTDSADASDDASSDSSSGSGSADSTDTSSGSTATDEGSSLPTISLTDAVAIDGLTLSVTGTSVSDDYNADNIYVLTPTSGKKYFVVTVSAVNTTGSDLTVDLRSKGLSYACAIGDSSVSSEGTILLNDLSSYQGTIPAGGTQELILLFQFPPASLSDTSGYYLKVKSQDTVYRVES